MGKRSFVLHGSTKIEHGRKLESNDSTVGKSGVGKKVEVGADETPAPIGTSGHRLPVAVWLVRPRETWRHCGSGCPSMLLARQTFKKGVAVKQVGFCTPLRHFALPAPSLLQ